jgi:hypothetical protein
MTLHGIDALDGGRLLRGLVRAAAGDGGRLAVVIEEAEPDREIFRRKRDRALVGGEAFFAKPSWLNRLARCAERPRASPSVCWISARSGASAAAFSA